MINKITKNIEKQELLKKSIYFLLFRGGGLLFGYFFTLFITNYYGANVWGVIALCFTVFLFTGVLGRLGIDVYLVKYFSKENKPFENTGVFFRVLVISFLVSLLLSLFLYLFRDLIIIDVFKKPSLFPYFIWTIASIPLWNIVIICGGLQRALQNNNWFAFFDNPGRFLLSSLLLTLTLFFWRDNPLNIIISHFYGVLFLAILALIKTFRSIKNITFETNKSSFIFLKESFPIMISALILVLLGGLDVFFIGVYETEGVVAIYSVSQKLAMLSVLSLQAVNSILAPKIAKYYNENNHYDAQKLIDFATRINTYITFVIVGVIIIFNSFLLGLFGEAFLEGKVTLFLLCIGQIISALSGSVGIILLMTGNQKIFRNITLFALLINILINIILIPIYGIIGAAIATIVSISFWNIYGAYYLKKKLNIFSYFRKFN
ncbi:MAG: oligosaccharide flippase family protein [Flavobacteriaceae bacterium]|nr:oligosaccharide flippase family protein [Flavobacteriaceae bacterium]